MKRSFFLPEKARKLPWDKTKEKYLYMADDDDDNDDDDERRKCKNSVSTSFDSKDFFWRSYLFL